MMKEKVYSCVFYRYLHQKDPNEWTLERLAESFPVDKFGVKKVLKRRLSGSIEEIDKEVRPSLMLHFRKIHMYIF